MRQLSGMDASFLYMETAETHFASGIMELYDPSTAPGGTVTFDDALANLERRLHLSRVFRQRLVPVPLGLDHPYWIQDPNFDLEYHVREIALPKPGDWRQLCTQAARISSRPFDLARPPWEIYLIQGLDAIKGLPPGSFALLISTHHTAVDGTTGMEILNALHDRTPDGEPPQVEDTWAPEREPSPWTLLGRAGVNTAIMPRRAVRAVGQLVPAVGRVARGVRSRQLTLSQARAPVTRFNARVTPHRVMDGRSFPLADLKAIKSTTSGATVNDVALAIVGGALRTYLSAKGELPEASLMGAVPISIRTPDQAGASGNQISSMTVPLHTDIGDPLRRLEAIQKSTHDSKQVATAIGARTLVDVSEAMPGALVGVGMRALSRFVGLGRAAGATTTVTNIPGPSHSLYFCGARLNGFYGIGLPMHGMGLFHTVTSYSDDVAFSATACREMMPDVDAYADDLQRSFEDLQTAVS